MRTILNEQVNKLNRFIVFQECLQIFWYFRGILSNLCCKKICTICIIIIHFLLSIRRKPCMIDSSSCCYQEFPNTKEDIRFAVFCFTKKLHRRKILKIVKIDPLNRKQDQKTSKDWTV